MDLRKISVVALSNGDFPSLAAKLEEAVSWLELAAAQGAELAVLPEYLNRYCGDGYGNPMARPFEELLMEDWQKDCQPLIQAAQRLGLWVTIPVIHRSEKGIFNSFFLVNPSGEPVWQYDKVSLTPGELDNGVVPGRPSFYDWRGVKLGGAICFDTCFPRKLEAQAQAGVELFLVPSLWPGGSQLNHLCKLYNTRVALSYPAWSRIIDVDGRDIIEGGYRNETLRFGFGAPVYTAVLNFDRIALYGNENQDKMMDLAKKYGARIRMDFDQGNCLWFLDSCDPDLAESALVAEFGLTPVREYFQKCEERLAAAEGASSAH